jgi:PhoH-like ATPase
MSPVKDLSTVLKRVEREWPELNMPEDAKIYLFDTNVLLHSSESLKRLIKGNIGLVPLTVLEEVDDNKKGFSEKAVNARAVARLIDKWGENGDFKEGIETEFGGKFFIDGNGKDLSKLPTGMDFGKNDSKIILTGILWQEAYPDRTLIVVSKDVNLRTKARFCGLLAEDYKGDKVEINKDEFYTGINQITVDSDLIGRLYKERKMPAELFGIGAETKSVLNQFFIVKSNTNFSHSALTRYTGNEIVVVKKEHYTIGRIRPKNSEQVFALNLLLDKKVECVTMSGLAGTGKTFLALLAGLRNLENKQYKKILVCKSVVPVGKDIGYFPGTKEDKVKGWMSSIFDNLDYILSMQSFKLPENNISLTRVLEENGDINHSGKLMSSGYLEVEALSHIRGRSIPWQYIIIEEAQNLTSHEVKTIITRAGEGTKVVLTGDIEQIDNPYLDELSNGLSYAAERLKGIPGIGHITLQKTERSHLASIAADLL